MRPACWASSTASELGADTAASIGSPASTAFWVSSYDARPETTSTNSDSGSRSCRIAQPITLSTALCRPMSSRTQISDPSAEQPGCVQPAGGRERPLLLPQQLRRGGDPRMRHPEVVGRPAGTGLARSTCSMLVAPQSPQALVVTTWRRASGGSTPAARVTSSTL